MEDYSMSDLEALRSKVCSSALNQLYHQDPDAHYRNDYGLKRKATSKENLQIRVRKGRPSLRVDRSNDKKIGMNMIQNKQARVNLQLNSENKVEYKNNVLQRVNASQQIGKQRVDRIRQQSESNRVYGTWK